MLVILAAEGPYWGAFEGLTLEEVACCRELPATFPHPILFPAIPAPCVSWHGLL